MLRDIGNLPFTATEGDVRGYFRGNAHFVEKVEIRTDPKNKTAMAAIALGDGTPDTVVDGLHGQVIDGRQLVASTDREVVINHEEQYG